MINRDLIEIFSDLARDKNVERSELGTILEELFLYIIERTHGDSSNYSVIVNIDKGEIEIYAEKTVVKVVDGDTVRLETDFRDFDFPLRVLGIDSLELHEGGQEAKEYLKIEHNIDKLPLLDFEIIKKEKLIEKFLSFFSGNINASKLLNFQGLISIWIPNI